MDYGLPPWPWEFPSEPRFFPRVPPCGCRRSRFDGKDEQGGCLNEFSGTTRKPSTDGPIARGARGAGVTGPEKNVWTRFAKHSCFARCQFNFAGRRDGGGGGAFGGGQKHVVAFAGGARHANERYSILRFESP